MPAPSPLTLGAVVRPRWWKAPFVLFVLVAGVAFAGADAAGPATAGPTVVMPAGPKVLPRTATTALSGAYEGAGDVAGLSAFGTWRGRPATVASDFVPNETWATMADPAWLADDWSGRGYRLALGVGMLPKTGGGTLAQGATGAYNETFRRLGQLLVSRGLGNTIIRLGWEMNGRWYAWSAVRDPASYVAYWRQVVTTMRAVPDSSFAFDWAPNLGVATPGFDVTTAYPGDAYVDMIGASYYDQDWSISAEHVQDRWHRAVTEQWGFQWQSTFAASHGKVNALGEWGLSKRCDGSGGLDNSFYLKQVHDWIATHNYAYESYFDQDSSACEQHAIRGTGFPAAAASYRTLFGATSSLPTFDATLIRMSTSADRSHAVPLAGRDVTGSIYVSIAPTTAVTGVRFYLDDPTMAGTPSASEANPPYDLVGGTAAAAEPLDVDTLLKGSHSLTVALDGPTGTTVASVPFTRFATG